MKAFRKNGHIFVLDNVKRIEAHSFVRCYEIRFYYNDGTVEKVEFLGNEMQMQATLTAIYHVMTEKCEE